MAVATGVLERARWPAERRFFLAMTAALALVVFVGFARSFFLSPFFPGWPAPGERFFALHGTVFAAWFALLPVQASLIAGRRIQWHRRLGVLGVCLAAAMVVLAIEGGIIGAMRPGGFVGTPIPPLTFLVIPLIETLLFAILVALAVVKRNHAQSHKRLMLIASISLTSAAFARWPVIGAGGPLAFFGAVDVLLLVLLAWDLKSRGRVHPVTAWAGSIVVLSQPLRLALGGTALWIAFAGWVVRLAS